MKKLFIITILFSINIFAREHLEFKAHTNENKEIIIKVQKRKEKSENIYMYKVVHGDTLSKISKKVGVSIENLVLVNNIKNPNLLRIGQILIIPK